MRHLEMDKERLLLEENGELERELDLAQKRIRELEDELRHKTASNAVTVADAHRKRVGVGD